MKSWFINAPQWHTGKKYVLQSETNAHFFQLFHSAIENCSNLPKITWEVFLAQIKRFFFWLVILFERPRPPFRLSVYNFISWLLCETNTPGPSVDLGELKGSAYCTPISRLRLCYKMDFTSNKRDTAGGRKFIPFFVEFTL